VPPNLGSSTTKIYPGTKNISLDYVVVLQRCYVTGGRYSALWLTTL